MDINDRLYVEIVPMTGPHAPHPNPVTEGRFDPDYVYKVLGTYNPSETSECYFALANGDREIWYIPQRHLRAYRLIESDEFWLPRERDSAVGRRAVSAVPNGMDRRTAPIPHG